MQNKKNERLVGENKKKKSKQGMRERHTKKPVSFFFLNIHILIMLQFTHYLNTPHTSFSLSLSLSITLS